MKNTFSLPRIALVALALGTASVTATFAQTTNAPITPAPTGGCHHHHDSVLTDTEKAQLKKDRDAVLAANPTLQVQKANLKQQFETLKSQGASTTKDQWHALHQQAFAFHKSLRAAELAIDPSVQPIFDKLEAAHQHGHHHSDGSSTSTPSST